MENELAEYDLHVVHSDAEDRMKIDFKIYDDHDTFCAEVFGDKPDDVEVVCEHPAVEFDDDETVGECPICGAWATWHWETSADDGIVIEDRIVDSWEQQKEVGGIVGRYLKGLSKE